MCMFDNDIGPPGNVVDVILTAPEEADIVTLLYWFWNPKDLRPMRCFGDSVTVGGKPRMYVKQYSSLGWHEGSAGGTGSIFIRRRVFQKIQRPYFKFSYDKDEEPTVGEDIYFTSKAHKAGCRVFTHLNSMCSHHRTLDLAEINAGVNSILLRYVNTAQKEFGRHGVELPDLNDMLAMERSLDAATRLKGKARGKRR